MQSRQTLFVRYCLYSYGGNTRQIAKLVQQETGGDLCEIEIATPYTGSYNDVVEQGQREVNSGFTPKLKPVSADLKNYDTVILGTPVWWYTYAPAMRTLLQSSDFSGKVIYPFATNGGWLGHTFADIAEACPTATVKAGLNIRFNEDRLVTPEAEILRWIKGISEK
ncbi:MAG: flavodoxin [Ruminococcus callidus]|nr:flavodoxin [Ruminococcus callidus]